MQHRCVEYSVERVYPLTTLTLLTIGLAVYLYSLRCFDAPVPAGIRFFLALLRIFFLAGLLWLITGPQLMETMQITQLPSLFAVLDDTGSMGYPIEPQPGNQSPSRFQAVMQKIQTDYIPYWKKRGYDTRFALLSSLSAPDQDANPWLVQSPGSTSAGFSYTDIGKAVHSFAASKTNRSSSYLLLFSDGQWNHGNDPLQDAAAIISGSTGDSTPLSKIFSFGIGAVRNVFDLVVDQVRFPVSARAEEPLNLTAHVIAQGLPPAEPILIKLQGRSVSGASVYNQQQSIIMNPKTKSQSVQFQIPALQPGEYIFTTEAEAKPGELFTENNGITKGIRIQKQRDRIVMLTSAPDWDFKFLKRVFENQKYLEVTSYLCKEGTLYPLGDRKWVETKAQKGGVPASEQPASPLALNDLALDQEDKPVLVLHDFLFRTQDAAFAAKLRSFVEKGGSILYMPGEQNTAIPAELRDILPIPISLPVSARLQSVMVNPQNMAGEGFFKSLAAYQAKDLPPLIPLFLPASKSVGGNVLLTGVSSGGEQIDLIKLNRFGLGKIFSIATSSFWRWDFQTGKDILAPFWLSLLYQCKPQLQEENGQLSTDGFLYDLYQPVTITFAAKSGIADATVNGVPIQVKGANREETVWLDPSEKGANIFGGVYTPVNPGDYVLSNTAADVSTTIRVASNTLEMNDLRQNVSFLQSIAEKTGGEYANYQAWDQLVEKLPSTAKKFEEQHARFLGEKWWAAFIMILLLGFEWFLRWKKGLP